MKLGKKFENPAFEGKGASPRQPDSEPPPPPGKPWWRWGFLALALAGVSILAALDLFSPRPAPPLEIQVPKDLAKLEPQLRAYVADKVKWVREAPRDARRHATLGIVYAANGLWPEARSAFLNVVQLKPKEPHGHLYVAIATEELGEHAEALNQFRQGTVRFPDFAQGFARLGDALLRAGVVEEAETAYRRLIVLAPQEWRGYAGLGDVLQRKGQFTEAAAHLETALNFDPGAKLAHHLLGLAYRGLGRNEEAQRELSLGQNALHFPMPDGWSVAAPRHMRLLHDQIDLASEYVEAGQPLQAVQILEEARKFHPDNPSVLNNLAVAWYRAGEPEKSRPLLERIIQKDPRNYSAYLALSASCAGLNQTNEALSFAERAIELAPNLAQSHVAKANVLLVMERDLEALAAMETAFRCDPKNARLQLEIGEVCWLNLDRPEEALTHFQKAIQLDPVLAPAYLRLAELHLRFGQKAGARHAIDGLRKIAPKEPALAELNNRLRILESQ